MSGTLIPLLTGPQDPSQLDQVINALIAQINPVLAGSVAVPQAVTAGSTTGTLPNFGQVTLNSTTRTSGTTGRYKLPAPVPGYQLFLTSLSTVQATVSGLFERSKTKLTLKSTAALASAKLPSVFLTGLSTSAWGVTAGFGNVAST